MKLNPEDQKIISVLFGKADDQLTEQTLYKYIPNPDGTIRWLYPKKLNAPLFLRTYAVSSLKAKVYKFVIQTLFYLRMLSLLGERPLVLKNAEGALVESLTKHLSVKAYVVFTGTVGENRKAIIVVKDAKNKVRFVKVALTQTSLSLIGNEGNVLERLSKYSFSYLVVPRIIKHDQPYIVLSDIKPPRASQSVNLCDVHLKACADLYRYKVVGANWSKVIEAKQLKHHLNEITHFSRSSKNFKFEELSKLFLDIESLIGFLESSDNNVSLGYAHGDFTPWNMYLRKGKLYLLDWELAQEGMPLMFDLFHFIYQSNILVKHQGYPAILEQLLELSQMERTQTLLKKYQFDLNECYMFYLVYNTIYYMGKYITQESIHKQAYWLVDIWRDALNDAATKCGSVIDV